MLTFLSARTSFAGALVALVVVSSETTAQAAPAPDPAAAVASTDDAPNKLDRDGTAFRAAAELTTGYFVIQNSYNAAATFGVQGRIGARVGPWFSMVYQGAMVGLFFGQMLADDIIESPWTGVSLQNAALAIVTIYDYVDVGVGPSVDFNVYQSQWGSGPYQDGKPYVVPGGRARIGGHIPVGAGARPAITVGIDGSAGAYDQQRDRAPDVALGAAATVGAEWF